MMNIKDYEFWFVAGSQHLYGEEALQSVEKNTKEIVEYLNDTGKLPYKIVFKGVMTTADGITQFMKEVNYNDNVAGVMVWAHTFSPAKDAVRALRDPNVSAEIKNRYLKDIVERIDYERPPNIRITKQNATRYNTTTEKGMKFHQEPFKISIKLKS